MRQKSRLSLAGINPFLDYFEANFAELTKTANAALIRGDGWDPSGTLKSVKQPPNSCGLGPKGTPTMSTA